MISDVISHYRNLLADHYSWSLGDFNDVLDQTRAIFSEMELQPKDQGVAYDLGCGPGTQAIPLAELGFKVYAVDTDAELLEELNDRKGDHHIETIQADMRNVQEYLHEEPQLWTCMGDSLSLLSDLDDVSLLLFSLYQRLPQGGRLILSFRDQTEVLHGEDRVFMLRSAADRIFSCALDYEEASLLVTDLVYILEDDAWRLEKSTYRKCRLRGDWMLEQLEECGFEIDFWQSSKGLISLLARK